MATSSCLCQISILCFAAILLVLQSLAAASGSHDQPLLSGCRGATVDECPAAAADPNEPDSEEFMSSSRRALSTSIYISYNALNRNYVLCSERGRSYYNCYATYANPYSRSCSAITRCGNLPHPHSSRNHSYLGMGETPLLSPLLPLEDRLLQLSPVSKPHISSVTEREVGNEHHEEVFPGIEKSKKDVIATPFQEKEDLLEREKAKKQEESEHSPGTVSEKSVHAEEREEEVKKNFASEGEHGAKGGAKVEVPVVSTDASSFSGDKVTHAEKQACNYAKGKWVVDDSRPLYSGFGCKQWLSAMWACRLTQRTDFAYEKLRWQPNNCAMEEFTVSNFLERMQHKTIAFVGDSLGRQQFQSLMCTATGGKEMSDVLDVGKEYGLFKAKGSIRPDGWAYRFQRTNTTILYYWSASLADLEPLDITNPLTDFAMHLDRPPAFLRNFLPKFDVLVLNTGHHWNRGKFTANRWVMHVGGVSNTNRKIADIGGAKNFTIYSIVHWVDSQLPKYPGLKAFLRTISPRHFFNGDWNTGGTCDNNSPSLGKEVLQDESSDPIAAGAVKGTKVTLVDITALSQLRDEGHISRYSIKATPGMQDCLHWCLPGVPDTWNEILFAQV